MKIVGLTGGIASGKSTASKWFSQKGVPVVDADQIARMVVAPEEDAYHQVVQRYGKEIVLANQELDRGRLGALLFQEPKEKQWLEELLHPQIAKKAQEIFLLKTQEGHAFLIYEVPLLFEKGIQKKVDISLLVALSKDKQIQRLMARNGFSFQEALARIESQMPLEEKEKRADFVVWNESSEEQLLEQLESVWQSIQNLPLSFTHRTE